MCVEFDSDGEGLGADVSTLVIWNSISLKIILNYVNAWRYVVILALFDGNCGDFQGGDLLLSM